MERLVAYIENNPVKADWWPSAWKGDPDRGCGLKPTPDRGRDAGYPTPPAQTRAGAH